MDSLGDVLVSMFWFMLLFAWIWMIIVILSDIFRDTSMSGWGKAGWTFFLIAIPWLGALVYLIARGGSMNERAAQEAARQEAQVREYVRSVAPTTSTADELTKLADLRERGVLTEQEYEQAKTAVVGAPGTATPRQPV